MFILCLDADIAITSNSQTQPKNTMINQIKLLHRVCMKVLPFMWSILNNIPKLWLNINPSSLQF